ncbi:uncharacterized protein LY79DRAFT_573903 [Colletotrichum navitas]|uniref:Uncharacterized protein n=1 Tax=Colletotrichum navitas TaxID=681940 RepID=A0AAD8PIQ0_9PEZI|nr:uncharacterized protein LY79DRAFT_573903 [Colletotrichum navitas]KAK1561757.1 hypothetical protein LY79DRAFT_573903 [Colletotrichum navitas]
MQSTISVIPQNPFILPGSIRLNIDLHKQASDAEMTCVLKRVGLGGSARGTWS